MQDPVSISAADLANVTGGSVPVSTNCSTNDQLLSAMQGIQGSLKHLGCSQNKGLFGGNDGAMAMMMMGMAMSRRNDVYVVNGGGGRCGGWWRSW